MNQDRRENEQNSIVREQISKSGLKQEKLVRKTNGLKLFLVKVDTLGFKFLEKKRHVVRFSFEIILFLWQQVISLEKLGSRVFKAIAQKLFDILIWFLAGRYIVADTSEICD